MIAKAQPKDVPANGPLTRKMPWGEILEWQLPRLMAVSGFRFATQLHEALKDVGIDLSYSHIHRLTQRAPERLTVDVQFALCRILNCAADELWKNVGQIATEGGINVEARQKLKTIKPVRARGLD